MANPLHLEIIGRGVDVWNKWRKGKEVKEPDLSYATLKRVNLEGANFEGADLEGADLEAADLEGANLKRANLRFVRLNWANLGGANLKGAHIIWGNLSEANLRGANLITAYLYGTNLRGADLEGANLSNARIESTIISDIDLSSIIGLDTIQHQGPSEISISTLFKSNGNIPDIFLRGCGVPDTFIEYVHSLTSNAIVFYSCFISHSSDDKIFVERLYADLQTKGVRCWYAPEDLKGGEYLDYQIDQAIRTHEKLLLILSESSMKSNWVRKEIKKAIKQEAQTGKRVLFPISLVEFSVIENWEFSDSTGLDLAEEIRKFYIPSFRGWEKDNDLYKKEFDRLLASFKQEKDE